MRSIYQQEKISGIDRALPTPIIFVFGLVVILSGFGCQRSIIDHRVIDKQVNNPTNNDFFMGLHIVDASNGQTLYSKNHQRNFTPASNTKIVTLYTALHLLRDAIPACSYSIDQDTLHLWGTGDPTQLHPYFQDSSVLELAQRYDKVCIHYDDRQPDRYAPGWAWEDYDTYFSPERNTFPMYGNVVTLDWQDSLLIRPDFFVERVSKRTMPSTREEFSNDFYINSNRQDSIEIPFITSDSLLWHLWDQHIPGQVSISSHLDKNPSDTLYSIPTDTLLKRMMAVSDNFIAEQLLLLSAFQMGLPMDVRSTIIYMLDNQLQHLPQKPRWVDGSGLSRYNLFSPQSITYILQQLYKEFSWDRIITLFPKVYLSDTPSHQSPFVFAKTGSLGNNYNLSGYLITRSGEVLIFSCMNNHYTKPTSLIKKQLYRILYQLWDN